ncbi:MAG: arsenate reductase [Rhodobacteraceae bacterium HLUCCA12]|nr:MAG: arsenate reductase [Rhodobacteraceae bacterium HLUCCA12]
MRRYPDRVPAGAVAAALGVKASTLSAYLSALVQSGLVTQERVGTSLRYSVAMDEVRQTFDYLLLECCRGRPDVCPPARSGTARPDASGRRSSVLFVCTGNSARSIYAEAILRDLAGDRFEAFSAGTMPGSAPHPRALAVLARNGHDIAGLRSKHIAAFQGAGAPPFDVVITVCDHAANEDCPAWPGQPVSAHWGLPDPVRVQGTDAQRGLAFHHAYAALKNRIRAFVALPVGKLDPIALQTALDEIGASPVGEPA